MASGLSARKIDSSRHVHWQDSGGAAQASPAEDAAATCSSDKAATATPSCEELSVTASADGLVLCKFPAFDKMMRPSTSAASNRDMPKVKSPAFHVGPLAWKLLLLPRGPKAKVRPEGGRMVSVFLKLKNRKAMAAAGLAHVCARTNFTLTIINRKRSLKHVANHFAGRDFSCSEPEQKAHGTPYFVHAKRLSEAREQFMPDGELHVQVRMKVLLNTDLLQLYQPKADHGTAVLDCVSAAQARALPRGLPRQLQMQAAAEAPEEDAAAADVSAGGTNSHSGGTGSRAGGGPETRGGRYACARAEDGRAAAACCMAGAGEEVARAGLVEGQLHAVLAHMSDAQAALASVLEAARCQTVAPLEHASGTG